MWGRPRGPTVAHCITICSATNARISSSVISISDRREGMPQSVRRRRRFGGGGASAGSALHGARERLGRLEHRGTGLLRLEHHGVAGRLEQLACQPLVRGVRPLHDDGASPVASHPCTSGSMPGRRSNFSSSTVASRMRSSRYERGLSFSRSNECTYQPFWPFASLYGSIVRSMNSFSFSL